MNRGGSHICAYVVEVGYDGKRPFHVGTFTVDRAATQHETEAAAAREAEAEIDRFWRESLYDGAPRPKVLRVRLGSVVYIADDYDWRRG